MMKIFGLKTLTSVAARALPHHARGVLHEADGEAVPVLGRPGDGLRCELCAGVRGLRELAGGAVLDRATGIAHQRPPAGYFETADLAATARFLQLSTRTWPMSPAAPFAPRCTLPWESRPDPIPDPILQ